MADDERTILRLATIVLGDLGYTVLTANDGAEALNLARAVRPDLVLTDALMPKMDGREVCKRLKSDPQTSSIKVIIMTVRLHGLQVQIGGHDRLPGRRVPQQARRLQAPQGPAERTSVLVPLHKPSHGLW